MGFRFFRRIKVAPGVTVNLSKTGDPLRTGAGVRGVGTSSARTRRIRHPVRRDASLRRCRRTTRAGTLTRVRTVLVPQRLYRARFWTTATAKSPLPQKCTFRLLASVVPTLGAPWSLIPVPAMKPSNAARSSWTGIGRTGKWRGEISLAYLPVHHLSVRPLFSVWNVT
jgi:hypothetical protein